MSYRNGLCCLLMLCAVSSCASQRRPEQTTQSTTMPGRLNEDTLDFLVKWCEANLKSRPKSDPPERLTVLLLQSTYEYRSLCVKQLLEVPLDELTNGSKAVLVRPFVMLLALQNDRERLSDLLGHVCPERFYIHLEMEYYLAQQMPDAGIILCNAYERATNDQNRLVLAQAIVRAFAPLAERAGLWLETPNLASRHDFVEQCKKWYIEHQNELVRNPDYQENVMHMPDREAYVRNPLWRVRP